MDRRKFLALLGIAPFAAKALPAVEALPTVGEPFTEIVSESRFVPTGLWRFVWDGPENGKWQREVEINGLSAWQDYQKNGDEDPFFGAIVFEHDKTQTITYQSRVTIAPTGGDRPNPEPAPPAVKRRHIMTIQGGSHD